jgi:biofilm PGA synthesis protein PgaD
MKREQLIIELPHLQSLGQRVGSLFVLLLSWTLWFYFLVPLVSLSGWLLGVRKFSAEVRWFGGYKSLIELLQWYGLAILIILAAWLCWTLYTSLHNRPGARPKIVNPRHDEPAPEFALPTAELDRWRHSESQHVTVLFTDQGQIAKLVYDADE